VRAVARALDIKAVPYEVVELPPPLHAALQRVRFGTRTVPAIVLESGEKLSGSRTIMRRLEELAPRRRCSRPTRARARRSRREAWGDEVWQQIARRLCGRATPSPGAQAMLSYQDGSRLPGCRRPAVRALAPGRHRRRAPPQRADEGRRARRPARACRAISTASTLDASGVLGGEAGQRRRLQIAATSRLMLTIGGRGAVLRAAGPPRRTRVRLFPGVGGVDAAGRLPGRLVREPQAAGCRAARRARSRGSSGPAAGRVLDTKVRAPAIGSGRAPGAPRPAGGPSSGAEEAVVLAPADERRDLQRGQARRGVERRRLSIARRKRDRVDGARRRRRGNGRPRRR
jgi:glutathione S-transferase